MTNPIGVLSYAVYGKETTYGTAPATINTPFNSVQDVDFKVSDEVIKKRSLNNGQDIEKSFSGTHKVDLTINSQLTNQGEVWELVAGGTATASGDEYTITPSNTIPSFTTQLGYKGVSGDLTAFNIKGCKVNSSSVTFNKTDLPTVSFEVMGQKEDGSITPQSLTLTTGDEFAPSNLTLSINGVAVSEVQESTFKINRNLKEKTSIGNRFYDDISETVRDYEVSYKLYFEDMNQYNNFWGQASEPKDSAVKTLLTTMKFRAEQDSTNYIEFNYADVVLTEVGSPIQLEDLIVSDVVGYAHSLSNIKYMNA